MAIMAAAAAAPKQLIMNSQTLHSNKPLISISAHCHSLISSSSLSFSKSNSQLNDRHSHNYNQNSKLLLLCFRKCSSVIALNGKDGGAFSVGNEEGISLGTMKLPLDTDIPRFELLLFQWANSLSQGAQLPLPVPLKVDKIEGGVRLGFVDIDDGKTQVRVYIDCQVISNTNNNNNSSEPPIFIATRNGALKNKVPLGEPRIMKSLLAALKKSIDIARL